MRSETLFLGCHLSAAGGFAAIGKNALSIGANAFQCFLRSPRGGAARAFAESDAEKLMLCMAQNGFAPFLGHAPYTLNACAEKEHVRAFAEKCMREDLTRISFFPNALYNFHPGSHVGQGVAAGVERTAALLNKLLPLFPNVTVLLETMAGQGSEIGGTFSELADVIRAVPENGNLGVCLDTCHVFAAGYDVRNDLDGVLEEFDRKIGLNRLKAVHLNDSRFPLGCHRDRHAAIGEGEIGLDAIRRVVSHPALAGIPFVLETPHEDLSGYAAEIALLRG